MAEATTEYFVYCWNTKEEMWKDCFQFSTKDEAQRLIDKLSSDNKELQTIIIENPKPISKFCILQKDMKVEDWTVASEFTTCKEAEEYLSANKSTAEIETKLIEYIDYK